MRIEPDTINILNTLNKPDVFTVFIYCNGFDVILRVSENNNFDKKIQNLGADLYLNVPNRIKRSLDNSTLSLIPFPVRLGYLFLKSLNKNLNP